MIFGGYFMYMHLGQSVLINTKNIIGVFDIDRTTISHITKDFLSNAEKKGEIENVSDELPKSFVVTSSKKKRKIYISQISTATLLKRSDFINDISVNETQI
jgi:phosphopantetheine adenylyltransferase